MTTTLITGGNRGLGHEKAAAPSVVNVTSGMGSFTLTHDPERVESQYPLGGAGRRRPGDAPAPSERRGSTAQTSPRQAPVSVPPRDSMNSLKRRRSPVAWRLTKPSLSPTVSARP